MAHRTRRDRSHKRYIPRPVSVNPILSVLGQRDVVSATECDERELQLRGALESLRANAATDGSMDHLIDAANVAGARLADGDFEEASEYIRDAKRALDALYALKGMLR